MGETKPAPGTTAHLIEALIAENLRDAEMIDEIRRRMESRTSAVGLLRQDAAIAKATGR